MTNSKQMKIGRSSGADAAHGPGRARRTALLFLGWALLCLTTRPVTGGFFYAGTTPTNVPWPGGTVPYEFDPMLTAAQQQTYRDGLREWELAANVRFVPRSNQTQYVLFKYDPLGPNRVSGTNPQLVEINLLTRGQICHELGHSLGFSHEHIRPDRDAFISVLSNQVTAGNLFWFDPDPAGVTNGVYDFESVMHFSRDLFSISPGVLDTLQPKPAFARFQPRLGNLALSAGDRAAAAFLYGPPAPPPTPVVTTTADGGSGSLRAALYYAMDHPGTTITFNIPTSDPGFSNGVFTIRLTGHLPPLVTDGSVIDGTTQPGFTDRPLIVVDGSQILPEAGVVTGLLIYAANCAVKNLSFVRFNWNGLTLLYADATNNLIAGCWCGLDATGTNAAPNAFQGILVAQGASRNTVGGTNALARNVLSGNAQYGLFMTDANTTGNVILGNYIGTDASGTSAVSNFIGGAIIGGGSSSNVVGGPDPAARNVLSGNHNFGLRVGGTGTRANLIQGNFIGLNAAGTAALPNTFAGMYVLGGATSNLVTGNVLSGNGSEGLRLADAGTSGNMVRGNFCGTGPEGTNSLPNGFAGLTVLSAATGNTIGGLTPADRNVLSGNGTVGLVIAHAGTRSNVAQGNFIGTDVSGNEALPNGFAGVYLTDGAEHNTLGGAAAGAGNLVSGNGIYGLFMADAATGSNYIQGNLIGTRADGSNALGNGFGGLILFGGTHHNVIGLAADGSGLGNRIAFNFSYGVRLDDAGTAGNSMRGNAIFSNGGLGIDLAGPAFFGVTPNDSGDDDSGPNRLQNYPTIVSAAAWPATTTIGGTLHSSPNQDFLIDVYRNPTADPSGYGQGQVYVGSASLSTGGSGHGIFSLTISGSFAGEFFTTTATDTTAGDTSEFSLAVLATNAPVPPQFTAPFALTGTEFMAAASLSIGQSYRIQATTNLAWNPIPWVDLTNFVADTTNYLFFDRAATNRPIRFYRVVSP